VLICGESGAGKTECCKFVLAYLIAKKESTVENIDGKLMATNDPLEAFGNAKTVNNDNSSRFAKCMQICLDAEGRVIGAEIQTSLLEKARSCAFFQQERNFHILYMLPYYRHVKCEPEPGEKQQTDTSDALEMLGAKAHKDLLEADQFAFIKPGDVEVDTEGQRYRERFQAGDIDWFKRVISSFLTLGYARKDIDEMMELLTAILHMGNIEFTNEDASQCSESTKQHVEIVADCFGLDATQLQDEIVKERIMMGGSLISKELNKIKAMSSRDAICKSIFQTIFLDIVERCNIGIAGEKDRAKGRVGVLDIFGFERMQFNSLEQICINYTNEKLHQTFINEVFETEKKVYRDEGLDPSYIKFTDNAAVLEMTTGCNPHDTSGKSGATAADIKKKIKVSLFGILDDVCKQEKNTGVTYCERVMKQWTGAKDANGPLFEGPKFGAEEFSVVHFAGPVKYGTTEVDKTKFLPPSRWAKEGIDPTAPQIDSFLTKNKDKVPEVPHMIGTVLPLLCRLLMPALCRVVAAAVFRREFIQRLLQVHHPAEGGGQGGPEGT
jgi:myosin heavy subunit